MILHLCNEVDYAVAATMEACRAELGVENAVLEVLDGVINNVAHPLVSNPPARAGGLGPINLDASGMPAQIEFYNRHVEECYQPNLIFTYGVLDEAFVIEPRCPVVRMGDKYAQALWALPNTEGFVRSYPFNPSACKVYRHNEDPTSQVYPFRDGDVFDVWVLDEFDAHSVSSIMAWGAIPVVPYCQRSTEWIVHGVTGLTYNNEAERDSYVEELTRDPILRKEIGDAARQWIYHHADIGIIRDLWSRLGS